MSLSYPSDLSLDEFELIKAFCPEAKSGGRPRTTDLLFYTSFDFSNTL